MEEGHLYTHRESPTVPLEREREGKKGHHVKRSIKRKQTATSGSKSWLLAAVGGWGRGGGGGGGGVGVGGVTSLKCAAHGAPRTPIIKAL